MSIGVSRKLLAILFTVWSLTASAQVNDIPLGTWRSHLSFNSIGHVEVSSTKVFAASNVALSIYESGEVQTLVARQQLSDANITAIGHNVANDKLVVGYGNGNIDIVSNDGTVTNLARLKELSSITGSKKINDIYTRGDLAYLSTDFGVVLIDLSRDEIRETWRDLGVNGERVPILFATSTTDSVVLATPTMIMLGSINDNLLDFSKWKRKPTPAQMITGLEAANGTVYVAIGDAGLFAYDGFQMQGVAGLEGRPVDFITAAANDLLVITNGTIEIKTPSGLTTLTHPAVQNPKDVKKNGNTFWIADGETGLSAIENGQLTSFKPEGPSFEQPFRISYSESKILAVAGGFTENAQPLGLPGELSIFQNGRWTNLTLPVTDLTDALYFNNQLFVASFSNGLIRVEEDGSYFFYTTANSELEADDDGKIRITDLEVAFGNLCIFNHGSSSPLKLLRADGSWKSYSIDFFSAQFAHDLRIDRTGNAWLAIDENAGGGLLHFNPTTNTPTFLTTTNSRGGLPHIHVTSLAVDRDNNTWTGTESGVAYFYSEQAESVKPILENRFLLRDEKITAIAVDGGDRKWIGTERGLWLVSPTGEALIHNFTEDNSPLLSNAITDIAVHATSGEVFIGTTNGIISFRADATDAGDQFKAVKIFPNPITSSFAGLVGISGLATDAIVKITDLKGRVLWQGAANGGTASWNLGDVGGRRLNTGIYLVFAADAKGNESVVGKIAIIE